MKRITINIGTQGVQTTAAEMRKRLAQALSKIPGDQIVFFNLTLYLENYQPAGNSITKIPDSPTTRHAVAKYSTSHLWTGESVREVRFEIDRSGLTPPYGSLPREYSGNVSALRETPTIVYGELARPEND